MVSRNNEVECVDQSKTVHIVAQGREGGREEKKREKVIIPFQQNALSDLTFSKIALPPKTSPASHQCHLLRTSSSTHEFLVDIKIQTFRSYHISSRGTESAAKKILRSSLLECSG